MSQSCDSLKATLNSLNISQNQLWKGNLEMNWKEVTCFDCHANNHRSFFYYKNPETKASEHHLSSDVAVVYHVANNTSHFNLQRTLLLTSPQNTICYVTNLTNGRSSREDKWVIIGSLADKDQNLGYEISVLCSKRYFHFKK